MLWSDRASTIIDQGSIPSPDSFPTARFPRSPDHTRSRSPTSLHQSKSPLTATQLKYTMTLSTARGLQSHHPLETLLPHAPRPAPYASRKQPPNPPSGHTTPGQNGPDKVLTPADSSSQYLMSDLDPPAQEPPLRPTYVVLRFVRTTSLTFASLSLPLSLQRKKLDHRPLILPHKMHRGAEDPGRHLR